MNAETGKDKAAEAKVVEIPMSEEGPEVEPSTEENRS